MSPGTVIRVIIDVIWVIIDVIRVIIDVHQLKPFGFYFTVMQSITHQFKCCIDSKKVQCAMLDGNVWRRERCHAKNFGTL